MIELHTIATLLSFNETDMLRDVVSSFMASPQVSGFLQARPKFEQQIREQLQHWGRSLNSEVQHRPAPPELESEFRLYQETATLSAEQFNQHEKRLLCQLATNSTFHEEARELLEQLRESNSHLRKQLFLHKWRDSLVGRIMHLELEIADQERERLLKELEQRIEIASQVEETLQTQNPGTLWDLSAATLLHGDSRRLHHSAQFLA
ncbi:MAG: hypothetical protein QMB70_02960, partial [Aeromonadaceae bacterium]